MKNTKQNKSLDFSDLVFRKLKSYISVISSIPSVISSLPRNLFKLIKNSLSVILSKQSEAKYPFKSIIMKIKLLGKNILVNFGFKSISNRDSSLHSEGQLKTKNQKPKTVSSKSLSFYVSNKLKTNKLTNSLSTMHYALNPSKSSFAGFTLVELIVVITILAILGTIAFISFGSYSSSSRDSARVADINSLKKSFELYNTIGGAGYPMPDSYTGITYSGGVIWYQGTFGDTAFRVVNKNLSKKIVDPLTQKEYIYSLTASKKEYQLKADFENKLSYNGIENIKYKIENEGIINNGELTINGIEFVTAKNSKNLSGIQNKNNSSISNSNNSSSFLSWIPDFSGMTKELLIKDFFNSSFADSSTGTVCYINGSYNGVITKVSTGSEDYILAVPSLILTDTTNSANTTFTGGSLSKMGSGILQCNGNNSPCNITYNAQVVWSGSLKKDDYPTLLNNIKSAYSGSNITSLPTIGNILSTTGTTAIENVVGGLVKSVGGSVIVNETQVNPTYSCTGTLVIANANITNITGLTADTTYQTSNSSNSCYYTCKAGYVGNNCETSCPTGFISVPGNTDFNQPDFCVAKYEMSYADATTPNSTGGGTDWNTVSYNSTKTPVSQSGLYPIADITQLQAIDACAKMGSGYHLITNNEWMTIARNIEANSNNWSSGITGSGYIYNGVSNSTMGCNGVTNTIYTLSRTRASKTGEGSPGTGATACDSKRKHTLSNGQVIYDLAGNVREHVNKANTLDGSNYNVGQSAFTSATTITCPWGGDNNCFQLNSVTDGSIPRSQILPLNSSYTSANGIGLGYLYTGVANNIFLRGGAGNGADSGVFTLSLGGSSTSALRNVGFRCAK